MTDLVLLRHGQSVANRDNVYTGWSDVPLTEQGRQEAHQAGNLILQTGIQFEDVHTSMLKRAITTADIVMDEMHQNWLPIHKTWRLNERHYGALRGQNKDETRKTYGVHQVALWRRSFKAVPPLLATTESDRRYVELGDVEPRGESLEMAYNRLLPYWMDKIAPKLLEGKNQLVVAHGSTLRALIKYLEQISDEGIDGVEVANGEPIIYQFDEELNIISKEVLD
ncbi:2,3-bisphosphoglycerate-dependent phosphoglycerate mutase [Pediococcus parvulus]|jgi:2,3-bisphosphoglycerate-dependent phosphoglycerate mutase|uniref:2,3-bisphosphoglycerate-dependent phosphoglycerate mutase n=1 Tax=Pediococcus parvulus TaxID=54062 RepID=A0A176TJM5_9LACO|nr:2,3-diphosphoglycerate-dependent phosphoglycerate mutase [Pediococcus parvulus]MDN5574836.1 2,3-diphosphoglycerate-dependent phosphoglycerate mutase [Pediococcus sp.]MCT3027308.1 2,3-diphosphoglycerate-dependent phosphoglycerate mutase [Pediococcus parvulus]MDV7694427.1 2,3-bisphosphoglycerate-dependent phosphoglycerate mutase [Pediococcus parvulus]OAD64168.1 phosphoglycerate mutase [Pediococcus parvulus]GEL90010.1 2,3-bisphosphoglycerate-dependent phosphoglycerate mutase 1 [Pediococcus par